MNNNYPWTTFLFISTILIAAISYLINITDPGNFYLGIIIFPFVFIPSLWAFKINFAIILLGVLQLPIYGVLLDHFKKRNYRIAIIAIIVIAHFVLATAILSSGNEIVFGE